MAGCAAGKVSGPFPCAASAQVICVFVTSMDLGWEARSIHCATRSGTWDDSGYRNHDTSILPVFTFTCVHRGLSLRLPLDTLNSLSNQQIHRLKESGEKTGWYNYGQ